MQSTFGLSLFTRASVTDDEKEIKSLSSKNYNVLAENINIEQF